MVEFDVETTGVMPWSQAQHAFLYQFYDPDFSPDAEALRPGADDERIQWWFDRGAEFGIRAHNAKFDQAFADIAGYRIPGDGCWHDSMVVAHTINERRSVALKSLADSLLGEGASGLQKEVKGWLNAERARRKKISVETGVELIEPDYSDVPEELIVPYGLEDVYLQRRLSDQFDIVLDQQPQLREVVEFERKVRDALYAVEKRGLPCDREGYFRLREEVIDNLERLEELPREIALKGDAEVYAAETNGKRLEDFNLKSSAQVIAALRACGADMTFMATEDGEIKSADKDNLSAVDHPLADAILEFRGEYKVLSTYTTPMIHRHYDTGLRAWQEPFIAPDERVHANYRQLGARTGRMSCSAPNMQNQPRDDLRLRYNIRADEGYKLVAVDLSNVEMYLFAAYAGNGRLLEACRRGDDLHALTAKMIGIGDRKRAGGYVESARQRGKVFNFSVVYGGGLRTIQRQLRVDRAEARRLKQRYHDAYPEVSALQNRIEYSLDSQGFINDIWGRRYRCTDARKESYKFTNYLVQGTACQVLKDALIQLHADGVPVVALVHDEIIAHVPEGDAEDVKALITKRLTSASAPGGRLWLADKNMPVVPLRAEGDIVDRWSQAKNPLFVPKWAGGEG